MKENPSLNDFFVSSFKDQQERHKLLCNPPNPHQTEQTPPPTKKLEKEDKNEKEDNKEKELNRK